MFSKLMDALGIVFDGRVQAREVFAIAGCIGVLILAVAALYFAVRRLLGRGGRKGDNIFRNKKNQYKDRTNKKHDF